MRSFLVLALLLFSLPGHPLPGGTPEAAANTASYTLSVRLDPASRQLHGKETITYTNATNRSIPDLVFHLYLNAFKSADTIFLQESGPVHRGFSWDEANPGWIEVTKLRLAGGSDLALSLLEDGTLARADLPEPVAPGQSLTVEVEFTAQLPKVFARTGWALDRGGDPFFMVGQWFPKLGVWQEDGWNAYPFHANSEFFADFGDYTAAITLPVGYTSGATGVEASSTLNGDGTRTVTYHAEKVIDFAWTASPNFRSASRQVGEAEIVYLYLPEHAWSTERALGAASIALKRYSAWFGPYAYPRLTLVDVPDAGQGAGGMEYPSLVTLGTLDFTGLGGIISQTGWERSLEMVAVHEIAHQWWQTMVATNEAEEPWLDEGFADYSTARLLQAEWGKGRDMLEFSGIQVGYLDYRRLEYIALPYTPASGSAWDFDLLRYGIAAYSKPAVALTTLQNVLGEEKMNALLREYFARWRFGHPTAQDFQTAAVEIAGEPLAWFFGGADQGSGLVDGSGTLNYAAKAIGEDWLTVVREGELAIPVEISVTFANGTQEQVRWDGKEAEKTFHFERPLRSFVIDPQHKIVVELAWVDNGLARAPDGSAWLAAVARLVYRMQDWLLVLGGI